MEVKIMADFDLPEDKKPSRREVYSLIGEVQKDGYITLTKYYPNNPKRTAKRESYKVLASEFMSLRPRTMRGMFKSLLGREGARKLVNRITKYRGKVNREHFEGMGDGNDEVIYFPEIERKGPVSKKYRPIFFQPQEKEKKPRCKKTKEPAKKPTKKAKKAKKS